MILPLVKLEKVEDEDSLWTADGISASAFMEPLQAGHYIGNFT